jgi:phosphoglycerate dehydrogenase-like enzyme
VDRAPLPGVQLYLPYGALSDAALGSVGKMVGLEQLTVPKAYRWPTCRSPTRAHRKKLAKLRSLMVQVTGVTDAGLEHLTELANLQYVAAFRTKVTKVGADKAKKKQPKLTVTFGED